MIPSTNILMNEITKTEYPNRTYKVVVEANKISGYTDELDALAQTVYFILTSERYAYIIYSWDYGIELLDLYGKPMPYVISEIPRRVREALLQDDRISDVTNFIFEKKHQALLVKFTVVTKFGTISSELEVVI